MTHVEFCYIAKYQSACLFTFFVLVHVILNLFQDLNFENYLECTNHVRSPLLVTHANT